MSGEAWKNESTPVNCRRHRFPQHTVCLDCYEALRKRYNALRVELADWGPAFLELERETKRIMTQYAEEPSLD